MSRAMAALGGASRQSLIAARKSLDELLKGLSAADASALSAHLFTVVTTLDSSTPLRRALTDNSRDANSKAELAKELFGKSTSDLAIKLLINLTALRWSSPSNLGDVIEQLAVEAEASVANQNNELDRLEEEIFQFSRIVASDLELRQILNSAKYSGEGKRVLVAKLLASKVSPSTSRLLASLVSGMRGRSIERTIAFYASAAAARKMRVIAHVKSAVELSQGQKDKLASSLSGKIGQPVRLNVELDPKVLGGLSIRFADELIDATIVNRLADAGRALAV
ncbi:MAG: F0F1 ATP synthase subunit delta [Candidatus Nanopelagicales bacterium]|jgi:F-type H+-transporting ATPase subunit delta|nr:F0F1 ATP synthase subunit delta [Candidatus Nanopelagicales bacterium]MDP4930761.1 F0F1 ATP synthase subunit delta [Candidatus Nanopelagicaceae bacterium]